MPRGKKEPAEQIIAYAASVEVEVGPFGTGPPFLCPASVPSWWYHLSDTTTRQYYDKATHRDH